MAASPIKNLARAFSNAGFTDELNKYFDNIRSDDSGSSAHTASDAVTGAQNTVSDRGVYTRSGVNTGGMIAAGSMWMQALVSKSKQKAREGSLSYKGDMVDYTIGVDGDWDNNTTGVAFTYGSSDVNFDRDQKDKVKSYIGSVYNIWQRNNWYLDTSLSLGKSRHEGSRMKDAAALSTVTTFGQATYQPRIAFMYYRDFVGDKIDQQVNFAGQDYTIQGASAEKNTYELKVGLNVWNDSNMEINLGYTRVMQKDFSSDNFKFKFKYNF